MSKKGGADKIRNIVLMDKIADFMMNNISNLTSSRKIADALTKNADTINHKTVGSYLDYLCNAFASYKVRRYDIRGKKYLTSNEKYYLSNHAFRYAKLGTRNLDFGRVIENIVVLELMRRGYEIYVGVLYKKEIDFVAVKQNEKIYIQVSDDISNEKTFEREVDSLLNIKDAYPKLLLARTRHEQYQWPGWIERIENVGLIRSMSKKGCSPDNAACEGFFGRLKNEMFYGHSWKGVTIKEFISILNKYLQWYAEKRIKLSLGGMSPLNYRRSLGLVV